MKVAELEGPLLDLWVARAEGEQLSPDFPERDKNNGRYWLKSDRFYSVKLCPEYSRRWDVGGPIIERDQIFLNPPSTIHTTGGPDPGWKTYDHWRATVSATTRTLPPKNEIQKAMNLGGVGRGAGKTALLAAMRAKVASHFGDEVPDEGAQ
ncbi:phage protein NinX family protein [Ralstonia holmesii]|uniref:phage protein NinX family protein n=1 Tax=Ralstonia holmesii TaxID=3058602 RepID=UPI0028F63737|nr:phage protein NinX family protein [Ralstonia sp. LMG 32967]CAJ0698758.1 hypothetical protein R11007_02878 [Ralstonia sp. LMG 32967]